MTTYHAANLTYVVNRNSDWSKWVEIPHSVCSLRNPMRSARIVHIWPKHERLMLWSISLWVHFNTVPPTEQMVNIFDSSRHVSFVFCCSYVTPVALICLLTEILCIFTVTYRPFFSFTWLPGKNKQFNRKKVKKIPNECGSHLHFRLNLWTRSKRILRSSEHISAHISYSKNVSGQLSGLRPVSHFENKLFFLGVNQLLSTI